MKTSSFDYHLPKRLIAQSPIRPRDHSRLLVLDRKTGQLEHQYFYELLALLRPGDVLVFNNSKVFKARLWGKKQTGGKIEVFLLRQIKSSVWEVLIGGRGGNVGLKVNFGQTLSGEIIKQQDSIRLMRFSLSGKRLQDEIDALGAVPLPPYIKSSARLEQYQTVYAKKRGSAAAPTAGLHFTKRLLRALKKKGVQLEYVTLHVGLGTFQPIKTDKIEDHRLHSELATIDQKTAKRLNRAKREGRRIIAVGTTTVRTLEESALLSLRANPPLRRMKRSQPEAGHPLGGNPRIKPRDRHVASLLAMTGKDTNLYITPGYKFKFVDALLTNFHLPQSSLLVLASAFASHKKIMAAYQTAISKKYRFYSFGDAMLII